MLISIFKIMNSNIFTYFRYLRSKCMPPNPRKDDPLFEIHVAVFFPDLFHGVVFADHGTKYFVKQNTI